MSSLAKTIALMIDRRTARMAKSLPGVVVSYDEASETCSVKPAVHDLVTTEYDPNEDYVEEMPVIHNVPVAWPRAQGFSLVGSLEPGDSVLLVACDRDISGWRRSGKPAEPDYAQRHGWGACVALPGVQADQGAFPTPSHAAALDNRVEAELNSLRDKLNDLVTAFNQHVHASSGVGPTPVPLVIPALPAPAVGDVGSTILKLEE